MHSLSCPLFSQRHKLATIVAGAGYGKSTLAAECLHRLGRPFAW